MIRANNIMYDLQFNDFQKYDLVTSSLAGYCVHSVYSAQKLLSTLGTSCKYNHIVFSYSSTY